MSDYSSSQPMPARATFSVGAVIGRSFGTYFANFVSFTVLALVLYLPTLLLTSAQVNTVAGESWQVSVGTGADSWTEALILLLSMVLTYVLVGALVFGAVQHLNGRKPGLGDIVRQGLTRIVPVIVIAILFSIAFGIGLALLIVPGLFLLVVWSVAVPAAVIERPGIFGAFSRSWQLTKGYRWPVLGILLILLAILVGLQLTIGILAAITVLATDSLFLVIGINYVIQAIAGALMSVAMAVLYHDLRVAKEGVSTAQLAAVFD